MIMSGITSCAVSVHSVNRCGTPLAFSGVYPARAYKEFEQLTQAGGLLKEKEDMNRKQKGFSLIELLIVVAIILIIAAIAIPNLLRARMAANESSAAGSLRSINTANASVPFDLRTQLCSDPRGFGRRASGSECRGSLHCSEPD